MSRPYYYTHNRGISLLLCCLLYCSTATAFTVDPHHYHFPNIATKSSSSTSSLSMNWFEGMTGTIDRNKGPQSETKFIEILSLIGSGSYGTVHQARFSDEEEDGRKVFVAKRAWTEKELQRPEDPTTTKEVSDEEMYADKKTVKARAERCRYYLDVEEQCLTKLIPAAITDNDDDDVSVTEAKKRIPTLLGKYRDNSPEQHEWLLFEFIPRFIQDDGGDEALASPARSLKAVMDLDWISQHTESADVHIDGEDNNNDNFEGQQEGQNSHLHLIHKEFQMQSQTSSSLSDTTTVYEDTLDLVLKSLLKCVVEIHDYNIVHRDIKPDNLLIDGENQEFVLIDFGSAQDIDTMKKMTFAQEATVALSPIYAAPECFIEWDKDPLNFDMFSVGLVFCQLLFNLLDDRTDAGFRQQLEDADFDMDLWLERELQATLRPNGIEDGLEYLGNKPGLWGLLKSLLQKDPRKRVSSREALQIVNEILSIDVNTIEDRIKKDGSYFDYVIQDLDICSLSMDKPEGENEMSTDEQPNYRPLHFVATFDRDESLGLILAEVDTQMDKDYKFGKEWQAATAKGNAGDVFVQDIVGLGQAERIGVFEIGDRVAGVGEFPHQGTGFEGFVSMLEAVPAKSKTIKVHFDRRSERSAMNSAVKGTKSIDSKKTSLISHGAWSMKGRRKTQEDTFVLHEIQSGGNDILLSGVFDGHGGDSASKSVSQSLPVLLASELQSSDEPLKLTLDTTWDICCDSYREGCSLLGSSCIAEYDEREGSIHAGTSSKDLIPGCTATVSALCFDTEGAISDLVVLNCGDSRTLVVGEPISKNSYVHFVTRDHSPSCLLEDKRLRANPNFSNPECSMNKYWLKVGDYRYAVSRSLEGPLATSKGIINESDLYSIDLAQMSMLCKEGIIIQASDGLFEVLDNEEVAKNAVAIRKEGLTSQECAKILCRMAVRKNTSDNVSVIVIYLE